MVVRSHLLTAAAFTAAVLAGPRCQASPTAFPGGDGSASSTCSSFQPLSSGLNNGLSRPISPDIVPAEPGASSADGELLEAPARLAVAPGTSLMDATGSPSRGTPASTGGASSGNPFDASHSPAVAPSTPGASLSSAAPGRLGPCSLTGAAGPESARLQGALSASSPWPLPAAPESPEPEIARGWDAVRSPGRSGSWPLALIGLAAIFFTACSPRRRSI